MDRIAQRFGVTANLTLMPLFGILLPQPVTQQPPIRLDQACGHVRAAVGIELSNAIITEAEIALRPADFGIDKNPIDAARDLFAEPGQLDPIFDVHIPQAIIEEADPIRTRAVALDRPRSARIARGVLAKLG